MDLFEYLLKLQKLNNNFIIGAVNKSVRYSRKDLIRLQAKQHDEGVSSKGDVLGTYTIKTEILSGGLKRFGHRYNLKDTGSFRRKMYLNSKRKDMSVIFNIGSKDKKEQLLETTINKDIFGYTDSNLSEFSDILQNSFVEVLNNKLK